MNKTDYEVLYNYLFPTKSPDITSSAWFQKNSCLLCIKRSIYSKDESLKKASCTQFFWCFCFKTLNNRSPYASTCQHHLWKQIYNNIISSGIFSFRIVTLTYILRHLQYWAKCNNKHVSCFSKYDLFPRAMSEPDKPSVNTKQVL